jgi:hypothetical protein
MNVGKPHYTFILENDNKHIAEIKTPTDNIKKLGDKNLKDLELNDENIETIKTHFQEKIKNLEQEKADKEKAAAEAAQKAADDAASKAKADEVKSAEEPVVEEPVVEEPVVEEPVVEEPVVEEPVVEEPVVEGGPTLEERTAARKEKDQEESIGLAGMGITAGGKKRKTQKKRRTRRSRKNKRKTSKK